MCPPCRVELQQLARHKGDPNIPRASSEDLSSALHAALWDKNEQVTGRRRAIGTPVTATTIPDRTPTPGERTSPHAAGAGDDNAAAAIGGDGSAGSGVPALPQVGGDDARAAGEPGLGGDVRAAAAENGNGGAPSNFLGDTEQDINERVEFMKKLAEVRGAGRGRGGCDSSAMAVALVAPSSRPAVFCLVLCSILRAQTVAAVARRRLEWRADALSRVSVPAASTAVAFFCRLVQPHCSCGCRCLKTRATSMRRASLSTRLVKVRTR